MALLLVKLLCLAIFFACVGLYVLYTPRLMPYILLATLLIPWELYTPLSLQIKELCILGCLAIVLFRAQHFKILLLDFPGKLYASFLGLCIVYYVLQLLQSQPNADISFLTHVLITTILIGCEYLIIFNTPFTDDKQIKRFTYFAGAVALCVIGYILHLSYTVYAAGGFGLIRSFLSTQNALVTEGGLTSLTYIGNSNGKSWFCIIFFSFFIGYLLGTKKSALIVLPTIILPLLVASLQLSRGAMLTTCIIGLITLGITLIRLKTRPILLSFLIGMIFMSLIGTYSMIKDTIIFEGIVWGIEEKLDNGASERDVLVLENLSYITNHSYFLGKGFHYKTMTPSYEFTKLGYKRLPTHNAHNAVLGMIFDMGIVTFLLFILFFTYTFRHGFILIRNGLSQHQKGIGWGAVLCITALFLSFPFTHNIEKNIKTFSVYMILFAITNKTYSLYKENIQLNEK